MKKIIFLIVLFIIPTCIMAANIQPKVTKLEATTDKFEIKYNGEVEDGSYAVMCKLLNDKEEEVDLLSSPVEDLKFDGLFTTTKNGNYKIVCANYEGGEFRRVNVTVEVKEEPKQEVKEETKEETKEVQNNPKTGDNIYFYVALGIVSLISLGFIFYIKKKNN